MGFITVGGGPRFFVLLDAADRMAIGAKLYYHAKVGSFRDSIRVLRDSIRVSVFVWSFACLFAKFVILIGIKHILTLDYDGKCLEMIKY